MKVHALKVETGCLEYCSQFMSVYFCLGVHLKNLMMQIKSPLDLASVLPSSY